MKWIKSHGLNPSAGGSNLSSKKDGFTLLEILLVVVVIGIIATMALPRLTRKPPSAEWTNVLDEVNNLVNYARQEAISNQKTYRINFYAPPTKAHTIQVEVEGVHPEKPSQKIFSTVKSFYFNPVYTLPAEITIEAIYQANKNTLEEQNDHGYCYIIPNGLVQDILVQMQRVDKETTSKKTFKMSPFLGTFELLEGFVR